MNRKEICEELFKFGDFDPAALFNAVVDMLDVELTEKLKIKQNYNSDELTNVTLVCFESFTDEELGLILAFYKSDVGMKWLSFQGELAARLFEITEKYALSLLEQSLISKLLDE